MKRKILEEWSDSADPKPISAPVVSSGVRLATKNLEAGEKPCQLPGPHSNQLQEEPGI
jgi:hypothetical protein